IPSPLGEVGVRGNLAFRSLWFPIASGCSPVNTLAAMRPPLIEEITAVYTPESLVERLAGEPAVVLLRSALFDSSPARYSFVAARPFLTFRSFGSRCEVCSQRQGQLQFGNPWRLLDSLIARYELL